MSTFGMVHILLVGDEAPEVHLEVLHVNLDLLIPVRPQCAHAHRLHKRLQLVVASSGGGLHCKSGNTGSLAWARQRASNAPHSKVVKASHKLVLSCNPGCLAQTLAATCTL